MVAKIGCTCSRNKEEGLCIQSNRKGLVINLIAVGQMYVECNESMVCKWHGRQVPVR